MTDFFLSENSAWWFVLGSTVLACVLLAILQTYKPRKLCYKIEAIGSVLRPSSLPEGFTLTYEGEPVTNVHALFLRIDNWSSTTIRAADFAGPLKIAYGPGVTILDAAINEVRPGFLKAELQNYGDHLTVAPLLLDPGNGLTIAALLAGYRPPVVSAKITGMRQIINRDDVLKWWHRSPMRGLWLAIVVLLLDTAWLYLSGDISALVALSFVFTLGCLYFGFDRIRMTVERYGPRICITPSTNTPQAHDE